MMNLPDYWLPRPRMAIDEHTQAAFDHLLAESTGQPKMVPIDYTLTAPRWQFLSYVADIHSIVLHGSGNPHIAHFEPRKSDDLNAFGRQNAVYAAADGIWAMFFAIVDRDRYPMTVNNACIQLVDIDDQISEPFYMFSISQNALRRQPWRTGVVYLLPPETFVAPPTVQFGQYRARILQRASLVSVAPLARLEVFPDDFPFIAQIRGHDDARLQEYATALQTGGIWPDTLD